MLNVFQVNNKNTRTTSLTYTLKWIQRFSEVWVTSSLHKDLYIKKSFKNFEENLLKQKQKKQKFNLMWYFQYEKFSSNISLLLNTEVS